MALLEWKPAYSLGIPSVDHEHQELIGMINEVYEHMAEASDPAAIESCLEDYWGQIV